MRDVKIQFRTNKICSDLLKQIERQENRSKTNVIETLIFEKAQQLKLVEKKKGVSNA